MFYTFYSNTSSGLYNYKEHIPFVCLLFCCELNWSISSITMYFAVWSTSVCQAASELNIEIEFSWNLILQRSPVININNLFPTLYSLSCPIYWVNFLLKNRTWQKSFLTQLVATLNCNPALPSTKTFHILTYWYTDTVHSTELHATRLGLAPLCLLGKSLENVFLF